ncbi:ty3-gypsy retrotransposon protein, partial [Tanacetum coccineum]
FIKTHGEAVTWAEYEEVDVNEDPMAELKNLSMQETTLALVKQRYNPILSTPRTTTSTFVNRNVPYPAKNTSTLALPAPISQTVTKSNHVFGGRPRKMLSQKEYDEKRSKNQCFYCDQKYTPGHKCEGQMFTIEIREEEEEVFDDCLEEVSSVMTGYVLPEEVQQCTPHISLNSLAGIPIHNTMRVKGHVLKQLLHILIDSGSTHNFLDLYKAKKMGCHIRKTCPLSVSVAGGNKLISQYMVKDFQWKIQGVLFTTDVMMLPLGGCELVLGVQWLSTLGTIQWNFKELRMEFMFQGKKIVLRGTNQSELTWMSGKSFSKKFNQQDAYVASICCMVPSATLHLMQSSVESGIGGNMEMQALLEEYADVFEEPKTLPPHRSFDHQIPLKYRDVNVNVRPYRPSHSPFSSPIVMVKKKDGSWRMCIDYRQLNKFTIKDKFQITVIEELIDELQGAQVFFKLDLRSGYHQIRMKEEDVYKTSFKSHEGHYEFVVIPFGLINAPSTFQALMNCVFNPFLRKFALVFFDDILVYNPSVTAHIAHLKMVLQVMRENTLFVKKSKYMFGTGTVEYLGHVISGMGVATDPSKIQVIQDWPVPTNIKQIRGFLGLTRYYRRFIKGYAVISQPLTSLLKKNAF